MANARIDQLQRETWLVDNSNARIDQLYREVWVSTCQPPPATGNFNYIKTFEQDDGQINTLALDSTGILWQENVSQSPGVLSSYDDLILPGSYCKSCTEEDEEWMAFSNLLMGTDIPRHGSNLDRISQVGPGVGPVVVGQTGGTSIFNIVASPNGLTQQAAYSDPGNPGHFFAVNWSAGPTSTAAGNILTIFYQDAVVYTSPYQYLEVGGAVYIDITAPSGLTALTGTYLVASIGQAIPPGGGDACWYFTVQTTSTGRIEVLGGGTAGTFQMSLATMTLTANAPIQGGDQVTLAGVTTATWDGAYTILNTLNGGQYNITNTSLTSNVATYNYTPIGTSPSITAGEQVTVTGCTNGPIVNGTSIFNVTNATVVSATASTFTLNITASNVTSAAETANAIVNGTIFQFDPGLNFANTATDPIYGNSGGGTATIAGQLGAGVRQAVTIFQTRNGFLTAPSPPVVFETTGSTTTLQCSQIALGPPNVIARIVAFTGGGGGNFFYIPVPVTIQGTGQPTTYTSTVINDNVTTQATFTFTDAVLLAATAIDIQGNNLFNQIELGSPAWCVPYAGRMFYGLQNNQVQNFTNLSFDGGYLVLVTTVGTRLVFTSVPAGWTPDTTYGHGISVVQSPIFGLSYEIFNTSGSTQSIYGMIAQPAYQDAYKVPIILPNTTYSIRVRAEVQAALASGNLVVDLYSPSLARTFGSYTLALSGLTTSMGLYTGTLLTTAFTTSVPSDLVLRVYATSLLNNAYVLVDRIEIYPTTQPVLNTELQGSYVGNLEAFDAVTGPLGVGEENNQPAYGAFSLYDVLYILKSNSMLSTQDSPNNEPADWIVREVSNKIGTCGINSYDYGEEWAITAHQSGVYLFQGGEPIKISQEIAPTWAAINWAYASTIWVRNDVQNRRILVGVPMATPNEWLPKATANANPTSPNVILMLNYKELNTANDLADRGPVKTSFTGKLIAWDMSRKWSIWQIPCPYADFVTRADGTAPLFFCCGDGSSRIGQQVSELFSDYGQPINSVYTTYGFVKTSDRMEFGPLTSAHRNLYKYLDMNLYGSGTVDVIALPNTLTPTYPYTVPAINLATTLQNNVERPLNQTANRMFMQLESSTVGSGFTLSSMTLTLVKDPHAPVRGLG